MISICDELLCELRRYIEEYRWSFRLVSHIFWLKHNIKLSPKDVALLYEQAQNEKQATGF